MFFAQFKTNLPVLVKKVCFFIYIETKPVMLWENLLEKGNTFFKTLINALYLIYTFCIVHIRITDPIFALKTRLIYRAFALINAVKVCNYNKFQKNLQLIFLPVYKLYLAPK